MLKFLTMAMLAAAVLTLGACAHHEAQQTTTTSTGTTGYTK